MTDSGPWEGLPSICDPRTMTTITHAPALLVTADPELAERVGATLAEIGPVEVVASPRFALGRLHDEAFAVLVVDLSSGEAALGLAECAALLDHPVPVMALMETADESTARRLEGLGIGVALPRDLVVPAVLRLEMARLVAAPAAMPRVAAAV